jgi:hypothetical protein
MVESLTSPTTSYLCVEKGIRITAEAFYDTVKRRNQELFQCAWGASDFRQGMITLGREFISPNETFPSSADDLLAEAADHSTEVDLAHYAIVQGALPRLSNSSLARHRWLAKEWSSLLGMGPQKPPEPVSARGTMAMPEKLLDTRELAAQVSEMVADTIMSKLTAIGLTAENIKKLENLGEAPPLDAVGGASQAASLADAVLSKLRAIGLTEKNIKNLATLGGGTPSLVAGEDSQGVWIPCYSDNDTDNVVIPSSSITEDPFDSSTWATKSGRQGSLSGLQMGVGWPKHLVEGGLPLTETQQSAVPLRPPKDLHPFETFPQLEDDARSPYDTSRQRKRAAMPEVITQDEAMLRRSKKRTRHNEIDCEKDEFLMENDEGQMKRFPVFHSSPPASKPPGYMAEDILVENIQHRDQGEDDLLRENIRNAIQKLLQNPTACEKSKPQMEAILLIMRKRQDALITMRTGGGKSMLWLIPPLLDPQVRFIVVCPFTVLLDQQCELAQRYGLQAIKYGVGDILEGVQILFVQVEHVGCRKFCK